MHLQKGFRMRRTYRVECFQCILIQRNNTNASLQKKELIAYFQNESDIDKAINDKDNHMHEQRVSIHSCVLFDVMTIPSYFVLAAGRMN